ncbi:MAG: HAMP domain-containing histidine kinase [Blastochloris sp.]|nr:HAMP domain-containing histidine kinase [Blastochloris sp.]
MLPKNTFTQAPHDLMQFYALSKRLNAVTQYPSILDAYASVFGAQPYHISLAVCEERVASLMAQAHLVASLSAQQTTAHPLNDYLGTFEACFLHTDTAAFKRALSDTIPINQHADVRLLMPVLSNGQIIGVFSFWSENAYVFSEQDWKRLVELAQQAAPVIERVQQQAQAREMIRVRDQEYAQLRYLEDVAHDLRVSVNSVLHLSKYLAGGGLGKPNERQSSALEKMVANGRRLLHRLNNLLDVSRISTHSLPLYYEDDVDVRREIELAALAAQERLNGKPVNVICDVQPNLPLLTADRSRIRQILHSLVANACAATELGCVTISARLRDDHVLIMVEDTGPGVMEDDPSIIFDAFRPRLVTAEQSTPMGVGLAVAKGLVEQHGGQLWLENMPSVGALFCVLLPIAPASRSENEKGAL